MLATLVFEDDHVPPEVELNKVVVKPAQIVVSPEIGESVIGSLMYTILVTGLLIHPSMLV